MIYFFDIEFRNGELPGPYIHIWMNTSDDGPDQRGLRNGLHSLMASQQDMSFQLFFAPLCLKHQFQLVTQSQLKLVDDMIPKLGECDWKKYYSSLATLSHSWRAHLAKVRKVWMKQHTGEPGMTKMRATFNLPPLAVGGRWGSVDSSSIHDLMIHNLFVCVFVCGRHPLLLLHEDPVTNLSYDDSV